MWEPRPVHSVPPAELPVTLPDEEGVPPAPAVIAELYCNETLYMFWRLYHYLYDRLHTVRSCIYERAGAPRNEHVRLALRSIAHVGTAVWHCWRHASPGQVAAMQGAHRAITQSSHLWAPLLSWEPAPERPFLHHYEILHRVSHTKSWAVLTDAAAVQGVQEPAEGSDVARTIAAMQADFFALVHSHLASKVDSSVFEDQCRAMLGSQSYVLFTIVKLITKLLKTLQQIVQVCAHLHCIYRRTCVRMRVPFGSRIPNSQCLFVARLNV